MIYLELWKNGNLAGYLPKTTIEAAQRTARVFTLAGEYHPVIVAPRTQKELTNA